MIGASLSRRAQELSAAGQAFVTATVVRAQRPTSVRAGSVALVLSDGTIEGFVGGVCTEHSIRAYSLEAIERGEAILLRILPFGAEPTGESTVISAPSAEGAVTVQNPCLSGGAIEVFLEPVLPAPRLVVVGETPIAEAVRRLGSELGLVIADTSRGDVDIRHGDLALVVAAHGRDELEALRAALEADVSYVGLVASPKRGTGVLAELRSDGVPDQLLMRIDVPAGLDIGARTPSEIALSILASVVAARRHHDLPATELIAAPTPDSPPVAVDPICGMSVAAVPGTPSLEHGGSTVYFCCDGCRETFKARNEHARAAG